MPRLAHLAVAALLVPAALAAQQTATPTPVATSTTPAAPVVAPAEQQIAAAVLPLPVAMRAGATVLGYAPGASSANLRLDVLRRGGNGMVCLADDPTQPQYHVACYHDSMEPFMARGRALRREGVKGEQVDTVRFREVAQGKLVLPRQGGMLYSLTGSAFDPATNTIAGARPLFVMYLPFATEASTGLSAVPVAGTPWIMFPGTPKAHIMFTPSMR